jgi:UDP-N-acetylglucosamine 3-dehydrogenase
LFEKEKPDGVIVATEPENHKQPAMEAMDMGISVLVEKPIASTLSDAKEMIEKSKKADVVFTVGHTERFNPVISKIKELIDTKVLSNLYLVNTHRIGPFPKRFLGKEDGVLIDLAVHDFDIIHYLCGKIERMDSQIINGKGQEIYVRTLMDVEHNIKASSEFSWVSPRRVRTIEIYSGSGMVLGDYFRKEAWFYANSDYMAELDNSILQSGLINYGKVVACVIQKQEPLLLELVNFVCAIKGQGHVFVQPVEAKIALKNALTLKSRISSQGSNIKN